METIGRYRVIRQLGQGGMGAVYLCEDPTLERQVAIKLLLRDPSNVGLREEARTLAALNHKGIVTIHEVGDHDGQDFLVMEYLPGKTLRELLEAGKTPRMTLLEICSRVAEAVAAAHRAGILHRDIKPENILVTDDEVKVLDFGIARRLRTNEQRATSSQVAQTLATAIEPGRAPQDTAITAATNTIFGTPAYLAPEVFQGESSSEASDIYSLGIVVYECVAGRRPHQARTLAELIAQVIDAEPAKLDDPQGELISEMLAADPARRPDLLEVSSQLAIGRTLIPGPSPVVPVRVSRWPVVAIVVAIVALGGGVAWFALRSPVEVPRKLAIEQIVLPSHLFGNVVPTNQQARAQLAAMLDRIDRTRIEAFVAEPGREADLRAWIVITRDQPYLVAHVTLLDASGSPTWIDVRADPPHPTIRLASILDATSRAITTSITEQLTFERANDTREARQYYEEAKVHLDATRFTEARIALERAIVADAKLFEAWYTLAFVLAWQNDLDGAVGVAEQARRLAPSPYEAAVMGGVVEYIQGNYGKARVHLLPLDTGGTKHEPFGRELLYFLGEAWWHDGHFTEGFKYFERALAVDRKFRPITIHMSEYLIARREVKSAAVYVGLESPNYDNLDFAAGDYARVAESGSEGWKVGALEVLERSFDPAIVTYRGLDRSTYEIARALRAGHDDQAKRLVAEAFATHLDSRELQPHQRFALATLTEVLLVGRMEEEVRRAISLLARHGSTGIERHTYQRYSLLAAGLLRDRGLLVTTDLTHRNGLLATAITAELDGDRAKAIETYRELLREPTIQMDLPEKAALLRNLRAIGKQQAITELCDDVRRPVAARFGTIAFQRECPRR